MVEDENKDMEDVEVPIEEGREAQQEGGGGVTVGKVHISDAQVPMVGMFFAGIILLVAVTTRGSAVQYWAYGISVASVAMAFSLIGFALSFSEDLNAKIGKWNAYFLFLWCFIGACILTFSGPFLTTGNGYFAAWGLAITSILGVGVTGDEAKSVVGKIGALLGLGAASIVVIIAVISPMRDGIERNICIYTLCVACVSVVVVAVFQKLKTEKYLKFGTLAFFAILWIVLACLTTFRGPFLVTGNGYFGSWGGSITSVLATMAALRED